MNVERPTIMERMLGAFRFSKGVSTATSPEAFSKTQDSIVEDLKSKHSLASVGNVNYDQEQDKAKSRPQLRHEVEQSNKEHPDATSKDSPNYLFERQETTSTHPKVEVTDQFLMMVKVDDNQEQDQQQSQLNHEQVNQDPPEDPKNCEELESFPEYVEEMDGDLDRNFKFPDPEANYRTAYKDTQGPSADEVKEIFKFWGFDKDEQDDRSKNDRDKFIEAAVQTIMNSSLEVTLPRSFQPSSSQATKTTGDTSHQEAPTGVSTPNYFPFTQGQMVVRPLIFPRFPSPVIPHLESARYVQVNSKHPSLKAMHDKIMELQKNLTARLTERGYHNDNLWNELSGEDKLLETQIYELTKEVREWEDKANPAGSLFLTIGKNLSVLGCRCLDCQTSNHQRMLADVMVKAKDMFRREKESYAQICREQPLNET